MVGLSWLYFECNENAIASEAGCHPRCLAVGHRLVRLVVILVVWRLVIAAKFEASEKSVAVTYVLCLLKVSSNWEVSANPTPTKKTRPNPPPIASTNIVFNVMR